MVARAPTASLVARPRPSSLIHAHRCHLRPLLRPPSPQVCSQLHQTHADFAPALVPALARVIPAAGAATGGEGGEPLSALSRRLKLRLLTELVLVARGPRAPPSASP